MHMIGPHTGKELALMLSGEKPMAFIDHPKKMGPFEPYVASGQIVKFEQQLTYEFDDPSELPYKANVAYFCLPGQEWRAQTLMKIYKRLHKREIEMHSSIHIIIGKLLGYQDSDIADFLDNRPPDNLNIFRYRKALPMPDPSGAVLTI